jgi:hypothetical protein
LNDTLPILEDSPYFADWTSEDAYLPADFHSKPEFSNYMVIIHTPPANVRQQVVMVLGLGLMIRDISRAMEIEPDVDYPGVPEWVMNSHLTVQDGEALLEGAPALKRFNARSAFGLPTRCEPG